MAGEHGGCGPHLMGWSEIYKLPPTEWGLDSKCISDTPPRCHSPRQVRSVGVVDCGKCARCMARYRAAWRSRILLEIEAADRTWFGTLTYRDEAEFDYKGFQKWMKRLRKAGLSARYVVVAERGSRNGRWHWHVLLHFSGSVKKRQIAAVTWAQGYCAFRLVRNPVKSARYVSKYLTKESSRVRASQSYGTLLLRAKVSGLAELFPGCRIGLMRPMTPGGLVIFPWKGLNRSLFGQNRMMPRRSDEAIVEEREILAELRGEQGELPGVRRSVVAEWREMNERRYGFSPVESGE